MSIPVCYRYWFDGEMNPITDRRLSLLRKYVEAEDTIAAFARRYRVDATYVSQLLNGHRNFGEKAARSMEEKLGLEPGAFDVSAVLDKPVEHVIVGPAGSRAEMVFVPAIRGAKLSAGTGEIFWDAEEEHDAVAFRLDWMQQKGLRPERCKVWRVRGDSMEPRYSTGDSLLIDMSDRSPRQGKNFVLVGEDGVRVKQLRATESGGWEMYSLNPDKARYPTEPIVNDNFAVLGRVRGRSGDED